ncbi:MAG TPA: dTDP-4-dehydrorhamnose 3,5-epimerase family protein [Alphaproteobacteria bacterium]|nr:dTDP-4-dehydrorhamnose 3,5-epimerase family protein [Alphaproteobacteria bacterium]
MKFERTAIEGVYLVSSDPAADPRGTFARIHSRHEFAERGLAPVVEQTSLSRNCRRGTVRGLHYQASPHVEAKLVCCVTGALFDAVVDLRRSSPTFGRAFWTMLTAGDGPMIYVPEGCAHGFQTVEDDSSVLYMISAPYDAGAARGVRWDDPALGIPWPERDSVHLSERDRSLPLLADVRTLF